MLISDIVSMLAISRLMPTVTGPSEEEEKRHTHTAFSTESLLTEEDRRKRALNLHALQEWTASTQAWSVFHRI